MSIIFRVSFLTIAFIAPNPTQKLDGTTASFGTVLWPIFGQNGWLIWFDRLWASSGQSALENSRILVLSATSTSASILKNLVLPGVGHFTILDHLAVSPADAGNNFFLEGPSSIGKPRAVESVRLLSELNDSVEGKADTRDLKEILDSPDGGKEWLGSFQLVIAHNVEPSLLDKLSNILWEDERQPILVVVNEAGFLAEFAIQFHEHPSAHFYSIVFFCFPLITLQSSKHIQKALLPSALTRRSLPSLITQTRLTLQIWT
jgi:hypothetical protein